MPTSADNIFLQTVLENTPRLLGQLNRNVLSDAYGSFDRAYWHYRTNDINGARYQEAALTLAWLYSRDFAGNIYYRKQRILEWINASIAMTLSIQNKDGSFNEWYLKECSYVATAFVAAAMADAMVILGEDNIKEREKLLIALARAAHWLGRHSEEQAYNQLAGSVFALARIGRLTGERSFNLMAEKKFTLIKARQSPEGWWSEYGGPDAGYLSLMIDYLVKYYLLQPREDILKVIKRATAFLVNFLHPNLTVGGEYLSRNTEYLIPSGLAVLTESDENAAIITDFNLAALSAASGLAPANFDDRYLCYILYNWLQAGIILKEKNYRPLVDIRDYFKNRRLDIFYEQSGLRIVQNSHYYFVVNLYKGGAFRLYSSDWEYLDSGLEIKSFKQRGITNVLDYNNKIVNQADKLSVVGEFKIMSESLMKTPMMVIFKFGMLLFGWLGSWQFWLKKILRKKMIICKNPSGWPFKREFFLQGSQLIVNDEIGAEIFKKDLFYGLKTSYNFIPSSKFFSIQEINNQSGRAEGEYFFRHRTSCLRRVFNFK